MLARDLGAPRALATLLQRVGRSGHWLGSIPKGIFFPLTRDDLMQTAAAVRAMATRVPTYITIKDVKNAMKILKALVITALFAATAMAQDMAMTGATWNIGLASGRMADFLTEPSFSVERNSRQPSRRFPQNHNKLPAYRFGILFGNNNIEGIMNR